VMRGGYAPRTSPYPPGLSWRCFKRRNDTGFSRIPSRLAHRARPIRQYQAGTTSSRLLPPSPAIPGSGCLQLQPAAATASRWTVSHLHMVKQRLAAHAHEHQKSRPASPRARLKLQHGPEDFNLVTSLTLYFGYVMFPTLPTRVVSSVTSTRDAAVFCARAASSRASTCW
jgi:hypothetical protein